MEQYVLDELENKFTYHAPTDDQVRVYNSIRQIGQAMAALIREFCPDVYETTLAVNKVEEAVMWANSAVARHS